MNDFYFVEVLWPYEGKKNTMSSGDIDVRVGKGAILIAVQSLNNGWLRVDYNGTIGVVPESFVKRVEIYETVYAKNITQFTLSSGERDMPFAKGQRCILMEGAPNGWLRVRMLDTNEIGLVPHSYLRKVEPHSSYVKQQVMDTLRTMSPPSAVKNTQSGTVSAKKSTAMQPVIGELQKSLKSENARTSPVPIKAERSPSTSERNSFDRSSSTEKAPDTKIQKSGSTEKVSESKIQRVPSTEKASDPRNQRSGSTTQRSPSVELNRANPSIDKITPKIERSGSVDSDRRDSIDIAEEITEMDSEEAEVAKQLEELERVKRDIEEKKRKAAEERRKLEEEIKREEEESKRIAEEQERLQQRKKSLASKDIPELKTIEEEEKKIEQKKSNTLRRRQTLSEQQTLEQFVENTAEAEEDSIKKRKEKIAERKKEILQRKKELEERKARKSKNKIAPIGEVTK